MREKAGGIISIRMPGHHAFTELTDCLLDRLPAMERGAVYADIQTELFNFIEGYVGREPSTVGSKDAEALVAHFEKWFADKTSPSARLRAVRNQPDTCAPLRDRPRHVRVYRSCRDERFLSARRRRRGLGPATDSTISCDGCASGTPIGWRAFPWMVASKSVPKKSPSLRSIW